MKSELLLANGLVSYFQIFIIMMLYGCPIIAQKRTSASWQHIKILNGGKQEIKFENKLHSSYFF